MGLRSLIFAKKANKSQTKSGKNALQGLESEKKNGKKMTIRISIIFSLLIIKTPLALILRLTHSIKNYSFIA